MDNSGELIQQGYVGKMLSVNMTHMGSGVLTCTSDRTWQKDVTLGANTLIITFGHSMYALCMVAGELAEVSAVVSTQVPQWFETDTQKSVDVISPDNIMLAGRLDTPQCQGSCRCAKKESDSMSLYMLYP